MSYKTEINGIEYHILDEDTDALKRYKYTGELPNEFLRAVLDNDFVNAVCLANQHNSQNLPAFVQYLVWEMPASAWGNTEKVIKWVNHNGMPGPFPNSSEKENSK